MEKLNEKKNRENSLDAHDPHDDLTVWNIYFTESNECEWHPNNGQVSLWKTVMPAQIQSHDHFTRDKKQHTKLISNADQHQLVDMWFHHTLH